MKGAREYNEGKSVEERWAEKTEQRKLGAKGVGRRNGQIYKLKTEKKGK